MPKKTAKVKKAAHAKRKASKSAAAAGPVVKMSEKARNLGRIKDEFTPDPEWYSVMFQITHQGQEPSCSEPGFRILRFTKNAKEHRIVTKLLSMKMENQGYIFSLMRDQPILICKDLERQQDVNHVLPKEAEIRTKYIEYIRAVDKDFIDHHDTRFKGDGELARANQQVFIKAYNKKGWVKYMRKELGIDERVEVVPGNNIEAEEQTKAIREHEKKLAEQGDDDDDDEVEEDDEEDVDVEAAEEELLEQERARKAAAGEEDDEEDEEEDSDDEDKEYDVNDLEDTDLMDGLMSAPPLDDRLKAPNQAYATISYIIEDGVDMEVLVFFHGVYGSSEEAKRSAKDELDIPCDPLRVEVVDLYEWIYPLRMEWNRNKTSKRVVGLEETYSRDDLAEAQNERSKHNVESRSLRREARKKKKMQSDAKGAVTKMLGITDEQLMRMLEHPDIGAEGVAALARLQDEGARNAQTAKLIKESSV